MSKQQWVRTNVSLDLKVNEDESFQSVLRDLLDGMSQGDPTQVRVLGIHSELVEDSEPDRDSRPCACETVIG